jgi:hypothetical protein
VGRNGPFTSAERYTATTHSHEVFVAKNKTMKRFASNFGPRHVPAWQVKGQSRGLGLPFCQGGLLLRCVHFVSRKRRDSNTADTVRQRKPFKSIATGNIRQGFVQGDAPERFRCNLPPDICSPVGYGGICIDVCGLNRLFCRLGGGRH